MRSPHDAFDAVSAHAGRAAGSAWTFTLALLVILAWAVTGPLFGFSNTWQLAVNTMTTIVTFLMVFLLQHTQNKDTAALNVKLDALIAATGGASEVVLDIETRTDREIEEARARYEDAPKGGTDTTEARNARPRPRPR